MSAPTSVHPPRSNPSASEAPGTTSSAPAPNHATGSSNAASASLLSPSFPSASSRAQASSSASASASRSATSPPTTTLAPATAHAGPGGQPRGAMDLHPTLPSRTTQLHITEARAALVGTMSNMLDSELQSRASLLHANAAALRKQEKDVLRGTEALRKENDKLEKLARNTERQIKELGNVQNWAEVLERDFLVLEETMRLVKRRSRSGSGSGNGSDDETCSECSASSYWSGSYSADADGEGSRAGSRRGSVNGDANGDAKKMNGNATAPVRGEVTKVTVDEAVAASISEAMATDLHEDISSLVLDPTPSTTQAGSAKGKEPATEEGTDISITEIGSRESMQMPYSDAALADAVDDAAVDRNADPSAATGL